MLRACLATTALLALPHGDALLNLEVRVFDGATEVTAETRVTVHTAGRRDSPIAQTDRLAGGALMHVPAGIYDAQAVLQRKGRVVAIRWAERLVVMPYPDEGGHHLQVINFATGYGALQIRPSSAPGPDDRFVLVPAAKTGPLAPAPSTGRGYALFVVPTGRYDLLVTRGKKETWHRNIDVPLDRTRFTVVP